jgi:hypothetical protein
VKDVQKEFTKFEENMAARFEKLKGKIQETDAELITNISVAIPNYNSIVSGEYT